MSIKFNEIDNAKALYTQGLAIQKVYWRDNLIWGYVPPTPRPEYGDPLFILNTDDAKFTFNTDGTVLQVNYPDVTLYHKGDSSYKAGLIESSDFPGKKVLSFSKQFSNYPQLKGYGATAKSNLVLVMLVKSLTPDTLTGFLSYGANPGLGLYKTNNKWYPGNGLFTFEAVNDDWFIAVHWNYYGTVNFGSYMSGECEIAEILAYSENVTDFTLAQAKNYLKQKWFDIEPEEIPKTVSKDYLLFNESRHLLFEGDSFDGEVWHNKAKYLDPYTKATPPDVNPTYIHNGVAPTIGELNGFPTVKFDGTQSMVGKDFISYPNSYSYLFAFVFKVAEGLEEGKKMPIFGRPSSFHSFFYDTTKKSMEGYYSYSNGTRYAIYHTNPDKGYEDWTVMVCYEKNDGYYIPELNYIGLGTRSLTDGIQFQGEIAEISLARCSITNPTNLRDIIKDSLIKKYNL